MKNRLSEFYSEFITRIFSDKVSDKLAQFIGKSHVGLLLIQIPDFYSLVETCGADTGRRLLNLLKDICVARFYDVFENCNIIRAECVTLHQILISFTLPDEDIFNLGR